MMAAHVTHAIIWWTGALVILVALLALTVLVAYGLKLWGERAVVKTLLLMRLSTARYWTGRMEAEGLTACRKEYRRMVLERKPKTIPEFEQAERDDDAREKATKERAAS